MTRIRSSARYLLLTLGLIGSTGYALAGGGGGEGTNCCAKSSDCKEVDNKYSCQSNENCTIGAYKTCCVNTCPPEG